MQFGALDLIVFAASVGLLSFIMLKLLSIKKFVIKLLLVFAIAIIAFLAMGLITSADVINISRTGVNFDSTGYGIDEYLKNRS